MAENSIFKSRSANLLCTPEVFYNFITDLRNLEQFIPAGNIKNWQATSDDCSFRVPPVGDANVRISSRNPISFVEYMGEVIKMNKFSLIVNISGNENNFAEVKLSLSADLNPMLKMMASGPIEKFLELLISEMEKFEKWDAPVKKT
jgi:carbon monoxide dehydrogenase subunit G